MKKYCISILMSAVVSTAAFSQTTKQGLNKVKADPKTADKAAKADVQLVNKKAVADTFVVKPVNFTIKDAGRKKKKKRLS